MTIGHAMIGSDKESVLVLHGWFGDHTVRGPGAGNSPRLHGPAEVFNSRKI